MTLADVASFASIVSSLAVAASLVYLGLQTHQNAKHTRALISQGSVARLSEVFLHLADADKAAAWVVANGGSETPESVRQFQFLSISAAIFAAWEDAFRQHKGGLMTDDIFGSVVAGVVACMSQPGFRARWSSWKSLRLNTGVEFIAFVDGIAATIVLPAATAAPAPAAR